LLVVVREEAASFFLLLLLLALRGPCLDSPMAVLLLPLPLLALLPWLGDFPARAAERLARVLLDNRQLDIDQQHAGGAGPPTARKTTEVGVPVGAWAGGGGREKLSDSFFLRPQHRRGAGDRRWFMLSVSFGPGGDDDFEITIWQAPYSTGWLIYCRRC